VGITVILAAAVASVALVGGIVTGRSRGSLAGLLVAFAVLVAGLLGYVGLVAATSWM
jgi:hypothetical protein